MALIRFVLRVMSVCELRVANDKPMDTMDDTDAPINNKEKRHNSWKIVDLLA